MSPSILLLVLLVLIVLSAIRHALTRGLRRRNGLNEAHAANAPFTSVANAPRRHVCTQCGGSGSVTRMQESMQPRTETLPEFYVDAHGRSATRMVTRMRMVSVMQSVRMPCASCGGSGRSSS